MSIHVTVNADPVCIRRGGLMLSDLEQIKKYERGRRRRLRLEQVRQQSKNIASKILEQTKNIAKQELDYLANSNESKLKRMHEQKIMDIQRRYQEDMEDIGLAHEAAAAQPQPEVILQAKKLKNHIAATERGKEAAKHLKELSKVDNELAKQQERLRQVREIEDIRSMMVANLSKKNNCNRQKDNAEATAAESTVIQPQQQSFTGKNTTRALKNASQSPKKCKSKKNQGKSKIKVTTVNSKKSSSPQRIHIEVNKNETDELNLIESNDIQLPCSSQCCQNIDSNIENISLNQPEKSSRYNPNDYQNQILISSNENSVSSLISDDSSYFSDRPTPPDINSDDLSSSKHYPSAVNSDVKIYDHTTRQRSVYRRPEGIVEREDIQCVSNADENARKIIEMENKQPNKIDQQCLIAKKRGNNAILRDKVRRDHRNLLKNLDDLSREERKLHAAQITNTRDCNYMEKKRKKELNDARQQQMNVAFENAQNNYVNSEAVITIHNNKSNNSSSQQQTIHDTVPTQSPTPFIINHADNVDDDDCHNELSRDEQILEMLKKVERQKRLLLQEFGATLPNDIFSASMTPLFVECPVEQTCKKNSDDKIPIASPEIKVINVSNSRDKKCQKSKKKGKKSPRNLPSTVSSTSEIAVQTQLHDVNDKNAIGEDKSIQVELELSDEIKKPIKQVIKTDTQKSEKFQHIEPVVTIITHSSGDMSTSDSSDHGIVINVGRGKVEVTPKKSQKWSQTRSLLSNEHGSPTKHPNTETSTPVSRAATPEINYRNSTDDNTTTTTTSNATVSSTSPRNDTTDDIDNPPSRSVNTTTTTEYSRVTKVSIGGDNSINKSTTIESQNISTGKHYILPRRPIKYKETSDTSTSYASLPSIHPQSYNNEGIVTNITSILELVDSSGNETFNRMRGNISPVSTPELPSPRTMQIPSNIPTVAKVKRILNYDKPSLIVESQDEEDSKRIANEVTDERRVIRKIPIYKQKINQEVCLCTNPSCKQYFKHSHEQSTSIPDKIDVLELELDEELQNSCAEKIASLNAQIDEIRDEKRRMEFSFLAPSDDTSLMQLPSPKLSPNNHVQGLQNLVQNIEVIHNQLVNILAESKNKLTTRSFTTNDNTPSPVLNQVTEREKPRIVSNERVYFKLMPINPHVNSQIPSTSRQQIYQQNNDKNIVEKLSQEILEQSKNVERAVGNSELPSVVDINSEQNENWNEKESSRASSGYSPILADIPKIPHQMSSGISNGNGQYRQTKIIRKELSTIDELDSTDPVNRSFGSGNKKVQRAISMKVSNSQQTSSRNNEISSSGVKYYSSSEIEKNDRHTSSPRIKEYQRQQHQQDTQTDNNNTGENIPNEKSIKSPDSFLTHYSSRNIAAGDFFNQMNIENAIAAYETEIMCKKVTSNSSNSLSEVSGPSGILTLSPKMMERKLRRLGLSWLVPIVRKTEEAGALSPSSNSDTTLTINKRTKSSLKKLQDGNSWACVNLSDVSAISIRDASKSTEKTVLMRARTSTPNIQNFYCTSEISNSTSNYSTSGKSLNDYSDSLASQTLAIHG